VFTLHKYINEMHYLRLSNVTEILSKDVRLPLGFGEASTKRVKVVSHLTSMRLGHNTECYIKAGLEM